MKRKTIYGSIPAALLAGATLGTSGAWAATSQTFKGSAVSTRWGPVQVSIVVKSKKIADVKVSISSHTARSGIIDSNALPILKSEVLQAQSANINEVSGATDISAAYIQSLQAAINTARQHRALK